MNFLTISAYKFVRLTQLPVLRVHFLQTCQALGFKGTIILSPEGINIALSGRENALHEFETILHHDSRFSDIILKRSLSETQPFRRFRVKIKDEIITTGQLHIQPDKKTVARLPAQVFKQWLDEKRDITVLDTRNDYEYKVGSFEDSVHLGITCFTAFPNAAATQLSRIPKHKPMVTFCTGGVRCEKAGPMLEMQGFTKVYQLAGGILDYFSYCGGQHWRGECFVFDDRVAVNTKLQPSQQGYCPNCVEPLVASYRDLPPYERVKVCAVCGD